MTFSKKPGSNDAWFTASRVIDSHPWDISQLEAAEFLLEETRGAVNLAWIIAEQGPNTIQRTSRYCFISLLLLSLLYFSNQTKNA